MQALYTLLNDPLQRISAPFVYQKFKCLGLWFFPNKLMFKKLFVHNPRTRPTDKCPMQYSYAPSHEVVQVIYASGNIFRHIYPTTVLYFEPQSTPKSSSETYLQPIRSGQIPQSFKTIPSCHGEISSPPCRITRQSLPGAVSRVQDGTFRQRPAGERDQRDLHRG